MALTGLREKLIGAIELKKGIYQCTIKICCVVDIVEHFSQLLVAFLFR